MAYLQKLNGIRLETFMNGLQQLDKKQLQYFILEL